MSDYHVRLALEYFQARPRTEQAERTLESIVAHVCTTYALSRDETAQVQDEAQRRARQRGLGRP